MSQDDPRLDADAMTIEGETFRMIEALARRLGVEPIGALWMALDGASARDEDEA